MEEEKDPQKETSLDLAGKKKEMEPVKTAADVPGEVPEEIAAVVHSLPPDERKKIESFFASMVSVRSFGPAPNPLIEKMTAAHVDKVLDNVAKESEREFQDRGVSRRYGFWYFLVGLIAFFSLIFLLLSKDQQGLLDKLVIALLGFLGGYGVGRTKK